MYLSFRSSQYILVKLHVTLTTCSLLFRALVDAEDFMAKNEALPVRQQVKAYLASCEDTNSQDTEAQSGAGSSFRASPPIFNPSGSKYLLRLLISYVGFFELCFLPFIV